MVAQKDEKALINPATTRERKLWIDALRALAMLFVIFGHQVGNYIPYYVFTSPIKIPLFFMITGYNYT